jgi:polyhydroxybutyrate depolymerase
VRHERYARRESNTEVSLYLIDGGGHTWPGGPQYLPTSIVGNTTRAFDATETIIQFLLRYSLADRGPCRVESS